jgi:hypothetical protein
MDPFHKIVAAVKSPDRDAVKGLLAERPGIGIFESAAMGGHTGSERLPS